MMNINDFQKSTLKTKFYLSSYVLESKYVSKFIMYRVPVFFNLYENRLIHSEFLKEIFAEILENKEILRYNFQNKIFSLYTENTKPYIGKIFLLQRTKIVLILSLIILLIKSFPHNTLYRENKSFFRLYRLTLINILKSPFSVALLVFYKMIRKLKIQIYIVCKTINFLLFDLVKKLFLNYLQYRDFTQNLIFNHQNYTNLFSRLEVLQLIKLYKLFTMFWVYIFFRESIFLNRILKRSIFKLNTTHQPN
uniref:hypothetical protein n=1 Tax=Neustupella aerophytica TaxID=2962111 RepID=UPI00218224F4|nr:hypothetical protein N4K71_pgp078 [Neustupella aerophytica]UVI61121.1 hypothetical protein [Neustupella aerophytica]